MLGGALITLLALQVFTGVLLFFAYRPGDPGAFESVSSITHELRFGWLIRGLHAHGTSALVLVALLHAATTWQRRAYGTPREITWWTGLALMIAVLAFASSGTVLPWDARGLYAAHVGTSIIDAIPLVGHWIGDVMRGGTFVGEETPRRFFALHVGLLPWLAALLGIAHVALVHVHGLSRTDHGPTQTLASFLPKAAVAWVVLVNGVVAAASLAPPDLAAKADALAPTPVGTRPPWYFLSIFELLRLGSDARFAALAMSFVVILLVFTPFWDDPHGAKWRRHTTTISGLALVAAFVILTLMGTRS